MIKRWLIIGAGIAAGLGVLARIITSPAVATPPKVALPLNAPARTATSSFWRILWTISAPGMTDVSLSTNGENIAWTDDKGCVRRVLCDTGRAQWRTAPITGINRVAAAPNGTVAAYSRLNPDRSSVVFLHPQFGDLRSRIFAENGAVWSAAFGTEDSAFIGTGDRKVYEHRDPVAVTAPFSTDGMPESVAIAADRARIAFGTWSPAGVLSCSLSRNRQCWKRAESEVDRTCRVSLSEDGSRLMALSVRGAHETDGIIRVQDGATGAVLWEARLPEGAAFPSALLSANGEYVAVTYRRSAALKDRENWRLACFGANGERLFRDKGSALFKPILAAIAANGSTVTVISGGDTLFTLDRRGTFINKLHLTADGNPDKPLFIRSVRSSRDGRTLLLQRGDGKLMLLRASA